MLKILRSRVPLPAVLLVLLWSAGAGFAARNSGGTYSLPAGNPVVSGTTITSSWANNTLNDIKTEITNSLDRQGRGGMLAPLLLVAGTVGAPSWAFSAEPGSGAFRSGAGDWRLTVLGTAVLKLQSAVVTTLVPLTVTGRATMTDLTVTGTSEDLTISPTAPNVYGLNSEGNGTGAGVIAVGGVTNAYGLDAFGGGSTGTAIRAEGAASGKGAVISGGTTTGNALEATAQGGNSTGVIGRGFGSGSGGTFYTAVGASASDGTAALNGIGQGTNTSGAWGVGTGTQPGVRGVGGTTGAGVEASAGTSATSSARTDAVDVLNGDIDLSAVVNPESTVAFTERITPKNITKAWGTISISGTTVTVNDGFNVTSGAVSTNLGGVAHGADTIDITFASAFSSANYAVMFGDVLGTSTIPCHPYTYAKSSTVLSIQLWRFNSTDGVESNCVQNVGGAAYFFTWTNQKLSFVVTGAQ